MAFFAACAKAADDTWDFTRFQRPRCHEILHAGQRDRLPGRAQRRWRYRRRTVRLQVRMRNSSDMPELNGDPAAGRMHGIGHFLPAGDLLRRMDPRRARVAVALGADRRSLGQDQAGGRALAVILDDQVGRHIAGTGAVARQRRHDDAVGQFDGAEAQRGEEIGHAGSFRGGSETYTVFGIFLAVNRNKANRPPVWRPVSLPACRLTCRTRPSSGR